ncbi:eukaryotic translation initiation factor 4E family member 1c [Clupea harengus]|uniref:Eukaryotic translation initiation factor 4E family member 1c n=1 Tax=Clupea harengus TaxID=7950 RepID=A0A6P3WB00_CLUHA|nr:eukaryotic translation initiation factor 4E family member 1c [Clupea harengus]
MATSEPENRMTSDVTPPPNAEEDSKITTKSEPEDGPTPEIPTPIVPSSEQYIKHPLQNRWALWYFKNDKSKSWTENLRLIAKFDTVEDFWALYNHIQQPSKLGFGCDYCLFKDGIKPMWEDDRNKLGGRWLMTLSKQQRHNDLDRYWMETLLCLIGESFDEASEDACGAVVNVRPKGDKIAIWTANCQNRESIMTIGQQYKERLSIPNKTLIGYQSHDDTSSKSGSTTKNMYSV